MTQWTVCTDCGRGFLRDVEWKRRCVPCWKSAKAAEMPQRYAPQPPPLPIPPDMLRRLLQLCHPDKHGNSEAATVATQFLLRLRQESKQ